MNRGHSIFLFCFSLASSAWGQAIFDPPVPIGPNISGVQHPFLADIDGDGQKEVILGSSKYGEVVALKMAHDTVTSMMRLIPDMAASALMDVADLNGDGHPDIIRSKIAGDDDNTPPRIAIYLGHGDGTFAYPISTGGSTDYHNVATADLTGDGHPEIILSGNSVIDVYTFDAATAQIALLREIYLPSVGWSFTTADVTDDGISDLVIATSWAAQSKIQVWTSTLGPEAPLITLDNGAGPIGQLGAADFNGDGRIDLFAGMESGPWHSSFLVWTNTGDTTLVRSAEIPLGYLFRDDHLFKTINGVVTMFFINGNYGQGIVGTQILPDLTVGSSFTLEDLTDEVNSFSLADVDGDGEDDLVSIAVDGHLMIAEGGSSSDVFSPPSEIFNWNDGYVRPMLAINSQGTGKDELAFLANSYSSYGPEDFYSMQAYPGQPLPVLAHIPMAPGYWCSGAGHLESADMDNDGDLDLIGSENCQGPFSPCYLFCLEDSAGTYVHHCLGGDLMADNNEERYNISSFTVFDVNGDGLKDLLITGTWMELTGPQQQMAHNYVLIQSAPLQFHEGTAPLPLNYFADHHDLDGDGLDELLVQPTASELDIYHNDGGGNFSQASAIPMDHHLDGTPWIDMNNDSVPDEIWAELVGDSVQFNFSTISLTGITPPTKILSAATSGFGIYIQALDLDGDGDEDIILSRGTSDFTSDLYPYLNHGSYPLSQGDLIYHNSPAYVPLDADGDGDIDLAFANGSSLFLLENQLRSLAAQEPLSTGTFHIYPDPAIEDFTLDLGYAPSTSAQLVVVDMSGRSVLSTSTTHAVSTIDVHGLAQGLYVLEAIDEGTGAVATGRFMVAREK